MLVTRSFTAKKPKHRGVGNILTAQAIKMRLGVSNPTLQSIQGRLRAVFYYLLKVGDFIVRPKFVPKQKRLNHDYLFLDNKKPSCEGAFLIIDCVVNQ